MCGETGSAAFQDLITLEARLIARPYRGGKRKGGRRRDKTRRLAALSSKTPAAPLFIRPAAKTFWRVTPPPLY
jgi:hypothetical protein